MNVLFLNHKIINCGVYQYGKRVYDIIKNSKDINYHYYEIDRIDEYNEILSSNKNITHIIYNYHDLKMKWLTNENIHKTTVNIGIIHESPRHLFDIACDVDPDILDNNEEKIYSLPRPIYENVDVLLLNYEYTNDEFKSFIDYKEDGSIIIGSFGFGFNNKGFDKIVSLINREYKKAIIKFIIPGAYFDSMQQETILNCKNKCIELNTNPNVKLLFYHQFVTNEELLLFLRSNDANMFLYDKMPERSISSCTDYALSVKKPLIISDSQMFNHIYNDIICVYKSDIFTCIHYSVDYCKMFLEKYSNKNLINKFSQIIKLHEIRNISDKIPRSNQNIFKIKSVYYYYENNNPNGDVTQQFNNLYNKYLLSSKIQDKIFVINNKIFQDNCLNILKTLFINVTLNDNVYTFTIKEHDTFKFEKFVKEIYKLGGINGSDLLDGKMTQGEIIDKHCMYLAKSKLSNSDNSCLYHNTETFQNIQFHLIKIYSFFYRLLCNIHEKILQYTLQLDKLYYNDFIFTNELDINLEPPKAAYDLYKYNKMRQTLINYFDVFVGLKDISDVSNTNISHYVNINVEEDIYDKIPEINYLCLNCDKIYFDIKYKETIQKIFKNPNIHYGILDGDHSYTVIDLHKYNIDKKDKMMFEFEPLTYDSGGKLGDFINQLSIINEMFYETGRKGVLYIKELYRECDKFSTGIQKTFQDTYDLIMGQKYILDYKIYNAEKTDINLSSWRTHIDFNCNWQVNFKYHYYVDWGKHEWLSTNIDDTWKDKIIINISTYRFIGNNTIDKLKKIIASDNTNSFYFISFDDESYIYFTEKTGINIPLYKLTNIVEALTILNSCKSAYLGLSSIQTMCNALHKDHSIFINNMLEYNLTNLNNKSVNEFNHIIELHFGEKEAYLEL